MCETNAVVWIAPSRCSKREREAQLSTKAKPQIVSVEQNSLRLTSAEQDTKADVSTELQWQFAMQRRGIAFDQSGLIDWNTHQRWTQQLLATLMREPPIGFVKVHLEQVISADRELFSLMSAELQKATTVLTATPPPMAVEMEKLRSDPRVIMLLMPFPKHHVVSRTAGASSSSPKAKAQPASRKTKKPAVKNKVSCPAELQTFDQKDENGVAICWKFNMKGGCPESVSNGRCKKGVHNCIRCHRTNHSLVSCRAATN